VTNSGARILSVGMTGGIACGRTTVGGYFSRLGACVIDMDAVGHKLTDPGGAGVTMVIEAFGDGYLDPDGGVDRKALGVAIFSDESARRRLEAILHPLIREETDRMIAGFASAQGTGIAITDAALLVETGGHERYQRLIVVVCDPQQQLQRLMKRDGLDEQDARARIDAQAPLGEKARLADYLIDSSGTKSETEVRACEVYGLLLEDLAALPDLPERRKR
jgi:dephospho-CoA kinase